MWHRSIGSVIIELAYGEKVFKEHGPDLVKINTESMDLMMWSFQQVWLPNILPLSKSQRMWRAAVQGAEAVKGRFLPSWIPGIQFPKYVEQGQKLYGSIRYKAFDIVQKNIVSHRRHDGVLIDLVL
jgi:hypothetical protein